MNRIKGWLGEKVTALGMWLFLDKNTYRKIDNVILPSANGTTQIDHLLVSVYGIFVIETKNMKGWIFGDPHAEKWTQMLFGEKHSFQNPLRQNYRHVKCLSEYLAIDEKLCHPIVFFIGDCEFKTSLPQNVINYGLYAYIKGFQVTLFSHAQIVEIENKLLALKQDKRLTKKAHLKSLKERYASVTKCPRCGAELVRRVARRGKHAGSEFIGCGNYPKCKYTRNS